MTLLTQIKVLLDMEILLLKFRCVRHFMLRTLKLLFLIKIYGYVSEISHRAYTDLGMLRRMNIISRIFLRAPFWAARFEIAIS